MADIVLQKPVTGQNAHLTPQADNRLIFDFAVDDVALSREGDNLIISFEDGASITLDDFYVAYTSENMPEFLIEGTEVSGKDFFAALEEELMPAAGATAVMSGGSKVDTIAASLLSGTERLGGLDQRFEQRFESGSMTTTFASFTGTAASSATVAAVANRAPNITGIVILPDSDEEHGGDSHAPLGSGADVGVTESGVGDGKDPNGTNKGDTIAKGQITAEDPDGDELIFTFPDGTTGTLEGEFGDFTLNPDGSFTYELSDDEDNTTEDPSDSLNAGENVQESFTVEVSDGNGGKTTVTVTVNVEGTNDKPELSFEASAGSDHWVAERDEDPNTPNDFIAEGSIVVTDYDKDGDEFSEQTITINGETLDKTLVFEGTYGTLTVKPNGEYTYELYGPEDGEKYDALASLTGEEAKQPQDSFTVTTTDKHNASDTENLIFNVNGANNSVTATIPADHGTADNLGAVTTPHIVDEADLLDTEGTESKNLSSEGAITVTALDGLAEITLDGQTLATYENGAWVLNSSAANTQYGTLSITGVLDNGDGTYTVTYSYTLTKPADHTADDKASDNIILGFTDVDGSEGNATIHVEITDDAPVVHTEEALDISISGLDDASTEGTVENEFSGSAADFFDRGADGVSSDGEELGSYDVSGVEPSSTDGTVNTYTFPWGEVTLDTATGEYTITAQDGKADTAGFEITYTDKDGDVASKDIALDINNSLSVSIGKALSTTGTFIVSEKNLEGGTEESSWKLTQYGFFTVTSTDGVQEITIDGADGEPIVLAKFENNRWVFTSEAQDAGLYGEITILSVSPANTNTGSFNVNFTYTLTDKVDNSEKLDSDAALFESFTVGVHEEDSSADVSITVQIVDDQPVISVEDVEFGQITATSSETVSYDLDNVVDFGADGEAAGDSITVFVTDDDNDAATGYHLEGTTLSYNGIVLGTIVINQETNEISITRAEGAAEAFQGVELPKLNLEYTVEDGDGDETTGSIEASFDFSDYNTAPIAQDIELAVSDAGNTSDTKSLNATDAENDTLQYTITGSDALLDQYGELKNNNDGTFTFELGENGADLPTRDEPYTGTYTVEISDGKGGVITQTVTVNITATDNEPIITSVSDITSHDDNVATNTVAEGSFSFTSVSTPASIEIDGVIFTITQANDGTFSLSANNETGSVQGDMGFLSNVTLTGSDGAYTVEYHYTQSSALTHTEKGNGENTQNSVESFTVNITDADGGKGASTSINVHITDSAVDIVTDDTHAQETTRETLAVGYVRENGVYTPVIKENVEVLEYKVVRQEGDAAESAAEVSGTIDIVGADASSLTINLIKEGMGGTVPFINIDGSPVGYKVSTDAETGETSFTGAAMANAWSMSTDESDKMFELTYNSETGKWDFKQFKEFATEIVLEFNVVDADGDVSTQYIAIQPTSEGFGPTVLGVNPLERDDASDALEGGQIGIDSVDGLSEIIVDGKVLTCVDGEWQYPSYDGTETVQVTSVTGNTKDGYTLEYTYNKDTSTATEEELQFDITFKDTKNDETSVSIEVNTEDNTIEFASDNLLIDEISDGSHDLRALAIDPDGTDDILFAGAGDMVRGSTANDIVKLENMNGLTDLLSVDGGEGTDVLLTGSNSLDTVKALLQNEGSSLTNTEVIMLGNDVESAQSLQKELAEGKDLSEDTSWTQGKQHTIGSDIYQEFSKTDEAGEMFTILIREASI